MSSINMLSPLTARAARPAEAPACILRQRLGDSLCWPLLLACFVTAVADATWNQWTVPVFPLDAGREMLVPSLIAEGKALYRDIRCFYGPLGYWLNAGAVALLGDSQEVLNTINFGRFAVTLGLLWILARCLLGRALAATALASWTYAYFYSLVTPYSASVGWGVLLLTAGTVCAARHYRTWIPRLRPTPAGAGLAWAVAAAGLLSLAATTKHEYALTAAALMVVLFASLSRHGARVWLPVAAAAILPFTAIACIVLREVSLQDVVASNLWVPQLLKHFGGAAAYGPGAALGMWKGLHLVGLCGLLLAAFGGFTLIRSRRRGAALAIAGLGLALAAELLIGITGVRSTLPMDYPKGRLHALLQFVHLLCLPLVVAWLSLLLVLFCRRRYAGGGRRRDWLPIAVKDRIGLLCAVGYLSLMTRQVPTAVEMVREPFTPILFAWLLGVVVPRQFRAYRARRLWTGGVVALLAAATAVAGVHIGYYQSRPGCTLAAGEQEIFVRQRRMPYRPCWFQNAIETVTKHIDEVREEGIACVPEGAWLHALLRLEWPTRDTQWMPFCQQWVLEDLEAAPPEFLLVMETQEFARDLPEVAAAIAARYRAIETNSSGMVLYRLARPRRAPWRPDMDRQQLEHGTGWAPGWYASAHE